MASRLTYQLQWDEPTVGHKSAGDVTWGRLAVVLDGAPLWGRLVEGAVTGIHWTWVELLEWLALSWPWLRLEQGGLVDFHASKPSELPARVQQLIEDSPEVRGEKVAHDFFEFRNRHDLSTSLHGATVPSIWIIREGASAWVSTVGRDVRLPLGELIGTLRALGDEIAARLARHSKDARSREASMDWCSRDQIGTREILAIATGLDETSLDRVSRGNLEEFFEIEDPFQEQESPILAAARMVGQGFGSSVLSQVLRRMKKIPPRATPVLDTLSNLARERLSAARVRAPYQEGHMIAEWLRGHLGLRPLDKVEPEGLLQSWDVQLDVLKVLPPEIDAVACWGARHGPAVLINESGAHTARGDRSTLAHEIAHLLVDRSDALPVAEVLGGRTPPASEKRARAFAAEFLAPREVVGEEFTRAKDPELVLRRLANHYGASHEIIAWQARNSGFDFDLVTRRFLKQRVSRPDLF